MRILVVEDDDRLADMLARGLGEEGFEVSLASDGAMGLSKALSGAFDCVLLDFMLPEKDGPGVCRALREKECHTPIIMLTVRDSVEDKVEGLCAGADDYVVKPFSFSELLARIQAQLRRVRMHSVDLPSYGDLELDPIQRIAVRQGQKVELTPKEYALLYYLVQNAERIVSEKELIEEVWGLNFDPQTNVLNVYLYHLRNKIDKDFDVPLIHTIRGRGYRLGGSA